MFISLNAYGKFSFSNCSDLIASHCISKEQDKKTLTLRRTAHHRTERRRTARNRTARHRTENHHMTGL